MRSRLKSRTKRAPQKTATIPAGIQEAVRSRLERHVRSKWRRTGAEVVVQFRGRYAYVGAIGRTVGAWQPEDGVPSPLCRLGYLESADRWTFAFFTYSGMKYEPSLGASGSFVATAEEAFDCAARVYLAR